MSPLIKLTTIFINLFFYAHPKTYKYQKVLITPIQGLQSHPCNYY